MFDKKSRYEKVIDGAAYWGSYFRSNPDKFVESYLHIRLKRFQRILIVMMFWSTIFVLIACRGLGKTFISAVYCCVRCILYPGQILGSLTQRCVRLNSLNCWNILRAISLQHKHEIWLSANV